MDIQNMVAEMVEKEIENGAKLRMLNTSFGAVSAYIAFEKDGKLYAYGIKEYVDNELNDVAAIVKTESDFTVWNGRIDSNLFRKIEAVRKFYKHGREWYVDTKEEAIELARKHLDRRAARRTKKARMYKAPKSFVDKFVRSHKGWKSVNHNDIMFGVEACVGKKMYRIVNKKNLKNYTVEF